MKKIRQWKIGTSTGNGTVKSDRPLNGYLVAVYIDYAVTPNAATDVTVQSVNAPAKTFLTVTNNATSGWYYPREVMQDTAGATVTFDGTNEIYGLMPVSDEMSFTVAQGDADQETTVWVLIEADNA